MQWNIIHINFLITLFLFFCRDNFADYGTMLEIRDVQFFPDGRSIVDTIGGRRFKVVSRGKRDGYSTAKVEFIFDKMPPAEEVEGNLVVATVAEMT